MNDPSTPLLAAVAWLLGAACCCTPTPRLSDSALLMHPPPAWTDAASVRVVTYNIEDLPVVDARRDRWRMNALADQLVELQPDVVCLQEAFEGQNREALLERLAGSPLQHHHYFRSGVVGSGLLVISRWPIEEALFWPFSEGGNITRGDWWVGKGVALVRLRLPQGVLDVFDTHLVSYFLAPRTDRSVASEDRSARRDDGGQVATNLDNALRRDFGVRCVQMLELSAFVADASSPTSPAVIAGDFNCWAGAPELRIALGGGGLLRPVRNGAPAAAPRPLHELLMDFDHVFVAEKPGYEYQEQSSSWITTVIVDGAETRLSDHHAVVSDLRITPVTTARTP